MVKISIKALRREGFPYSGIEVYTDEKDGLNFPHPRKHYNLKEGYCPLAALYGFCRTDYGYSIGLSAVLDESSERNLPFGAQRLRSWNEENSWKTDWVEVGEFDIFLNNFKSYLKENGLCVQKVR
jgi:hypothetical protein